MTSATDPRERWAGCVYSNFDEHEVLRCESAVAEEAAAAGDGVFERFLRANAERRRSRAKGASNPNALLVLQEIGQSESDRDPALAAIAIRTFACAARYTNSWADLANVKESSVTDAQRAAFEHADAMLATASASPGWMLKEAQASVQCALFNARSANSRDPDEMLDLASTVISKFDDYLPVYFDRANHARRIHRSTGAIGIDAVVDLFSATLSRARRIHDELASGSGERPFRLVADRLEIRAGVALAARQLDLMKGVRGLVDLEGSADALDRDRFAASR
jgi:hypothetical protein